MRSFERLYIGMSSSIKFELRSCGADRNTVALQSKEAEEGFRSTKLWSSSC